MLELTSMVNMSPNSSHPKPKYNIYGFDCGSKSDTDIIKASMKGFNRQVRLPHFEQKQNMQTIDLILDIEGVGSHPKEKLTVTFTPRSLHFTVEDLEGEDIHLVIPRLAHEISPSQSCVAVKNKNTVIITLAKIKPQIWKTVFYNTDLVKKLWAQNMREFVQTIIDQEDVASVLKEIWNQAQIICTDDINFFLNAPTPFGPMQSLQGVNTVDEVIDRLKNSITNRNDLFVKAFFLGAAVLYKLQRDHDDEFKETDHTSGNESESASSNLEEENMTSIEARLKKIALMDVPERKAFANRKKEIGNKHLRAKRYTVAIRYYSEAIDLYPENPVFYSNRSTCHFILKNYDESYEDACKAIDLDPLFDPGFYKAFKALAALELPQLANMVAKLALEFDRENRKDFTKLMLGGNFGLTSPNESEETTELYIKSELRLKQMENFEKMRRINKEFAEKKDYEKVKILASELLEHSKAPSVANGYYYLSYSCFNLNDRESAFNYTEKCLGVAADHAPAKRLKDLLHNFYSYRDNGFLYFVQGKYQDCMSWYKKALTLIGDNTNHIAYLHFLIGLTKKAQKKTKDAIKCFSHAIDLKPDFVHAYFLRGESYQVLGRSSDAQANFSKAVELYKKEVCRLKPTEALPDKTLKAWKKEIDQSFRRKGAVFLESSKYESAAECYKLALLCRQDDPMLNCECSASLRKVHKYEEALCLANQALDANPDLGYGHLEKGRCLLVLGYVEKSISILEVAQKLLPESDDVKTEMGRALTLRVFLKRGNDAIEKGDFGSAEMYLGEARNIAYLDIALQMELAKCREQAERIRALEAAAHRETVNGVSDEHHLVDARCSEQDIPIADTYCIMGACAYHQGNKEEALSHFRKALEHDSRHEKAKDAIQVVEHVFSAFEKACDLLSVDNLKEAELYFKMGTSLDDENSYMKAKFHHGLGLTYFKMNEFELALNEFSSAINNDGEFADAYMKRGECFQALNNFQKGIEDFKAAIELDPAPEYKAVLKYALKHLSRNS